MNAKYRSAVVKLEESSASKSTGQVDHNALVGEIYDCAIAPERWEQALKMICDIANFRCAAITLIDRENRKILIRRCSGIEADWTDRYFAHASEYGAEIHQVRRTYFETLPTDAPMVLSRHVPREVYENIRYYQEWMKPQYLIDIMQLLTLRQADRIGAVNLGRHERWGFITDDEIALGSLLQPHLQRAVTISNLLEVQSLRANNLRSTIGNLSTGVMLLAEDGTILESNRAAERMIAQCPITRVVEGRLTSHDRQYAAMLRQALRAASRGEAGSMNDAGTPGGDRVLSSYILPLGGGDLRPNIREAAVGAMFITSAERQATQLPMAEVLGLIHGLTAAETRVAEALADGKTSLEAAKMLGISEATIRTHLKRIFVKTGTTRQAELISLMHRLALPLTRTGCV